MAARKKSEEPSINIDEVLTDEELKAVANESEPAERKAKPEDGPRTVVVAEDEAVNRMDLVAMLEDNGYEVVGQAANGEEVSDVDTGAQWYTAENIDDPEIAMLVYD